MSKKLLLADDSVTIQKVMQITFAHEDYELTITGDGDEAFQKALEVKPDLVLADVYMPGKNGYELCAALKREPGWQGIPVLLLAGSFEPFDEGKARAAGADAWLEKPFESQALLDKVAELLVAAPVAPREAAAPAAEPVAPGSFPEFAAAAEEDPFGTISFDEELPAVEQQNVEIADDWGDFDDVSEVEGSPAESLVESADSDGGGESSMAEGDFSFEDEPLDESLVADEETFVFEDEPVEEAPPAAAISPDSFADSDDEIMALNDDDILGSEDLEPLEEEPTLSAWSREDFAMEETLDDDALFEPTMEDSPITAGPAAPAPEPAPPITETATPVVDDATPFEEEVAELEDAPPPAEESTSAVDEDAFFTEEIATFEEEAPEFVEQVATFEEEAPAFGAEVSDLEAAAFTEPGVEAIEDAPQFAAGTFVEQQVDRLSEAELEAIVERVAGKVLERLADRILERVAWEVVPDLAEALIKEEISKIKEAAA